MVLQNYIELVPGKTTRLHLFNPRIERRTIRDGTTHLPKEANVLAFQVDELDGKPVQSTFSTLSEKLSVALKPWIDDKTLALRTVIITQIGQGYTADYNVQAPLR